MDYDDYGRLEGELGDAMGTYDSIYMLTNPVTCGEGHPQPDLQTKDLDCTCSSFLLYEWYLYHGLPGVDRRDFEFRPVDGSRILEARCFQFLPLAAITATLQAYTSCNQCRPVVVAAKRTLGSCDHYTQRVPWVEWGLEFVEGKLVSTTPIDVMTRDEFRVSLTNNEGVRALLDDDPLAIVHLMHLPPYERGPWWPKEWGR